MSSADQGSVALETVLAAPVVAMLVVGVLGATAVVGDQLIAERAARAAARATAVTGTVGGAAAALPADASLEVSRRGREITVVVTVPGTVAGLLEYRARATATAAVEPALP